MAIVCVSAAQVRSEEQKSIEPSDIVNLHKVNDPQISPDGTLVVYVVETPVRAGEHKNAHIWLTTTSGTAQERPFVTSGEADTSPRWSPDGKSIAFLSDRPNPFSAANNEVFHFKLAGVQGRNDLEKPQPGPNQKSDEDKPQAQIWIMPIGGGEALPLTDIWGGVKAFKWSKDGRFIAFVRQDQDTKAERERKLHKQDQIVVDHDYHFDRLWIYDRATQAARLLNKGDDNVDDFDWSPDASQLVVRVSPTPKLNDYWYVSRVMLLNASTGAFTKTLSVHAFSMPIRWSPAGDKVAFSEMTKGIVGTPVTYDLSTDKEIPIGSSYPATIWGVEWGPDGKALTAEAIRGTRAQLLRVDASSGEVEKLADVMAEGDSLTESQDGRTIAFLGQSFHHPDEVWVYSQDGIHQSTDSNRQVAHWKLGNVREINWSSTKDKTKIYGLLVLPWNYDPGKPVKTIVQIHGGPEWAWWAGWMGSWHEWAQMLASHGYAVLLPNPRGSDGQTPAFTEANFDDWGGGDFQDVMDGVDTLVKEKIADPDRLGIGGWSYGGFMTSWAITHTDRFKAAVVGAAVTDLEGMSTTTDIAPSFLNAYFGNFFSKRALYDEHSPMRYIDRCHTPALVLHGDADVRVPTFQGEEFYYGLRMLGREAELVRYPREPHVFAERDHQSDLLERVLGWYDSHIK